MVVIGSERLPTTTMAHLITCEEAARRLGVHPKTVRAWIRAKKIPSYRLGQRYRRVDWSEVLAALAAEGGRPASPDEQQPESGESS